MATRTHTVTLRDTDGDPLDAASVALFVVRDSDDEPVFGDEDNPIALTESIDSPGVWSATSGDVYADGQTYTEHWAVGFANGNVYEYRLSFGLGASGTAISGCPITIEDLRAHLRIDHADEDSLLSAYACAATEWVEDYCNRRMLTRVETLRRTRFPEGCGQTLAAIRLPRGPVLPGASVVVRYIDLDGQTVTLDPSAYRLVPSGDDRPFALVQLAPGERWPQDADPSYVDGIEILYEAGFGAAASSVPKPMIHAVRMLAAEWHRLREGVAGGQVTGAEAPHGVRMLLSTQRFPVVD